MDAAGACGGGGRAAGGGTAAEGGYKIYVILVTVVESLPDVIVTISKDIYILRQIKRNANNKY